MTIRSIRQRPFRKGEIQNQCLLQTELFKGSQRFFWAKAKYIFVHVRKWQGLLTSIFASYEEFQWKRNICDFELKNLSAINIIRFLTMMRLAKPKMVASLRTRLSEEVLLCYQYGHFEWLLLSFYHIEEKIYL